MGFKRPDSILLIKLSAIGDVVHTLPLLEVLRKNFADARIDWLVEEESSHLILGHRDIDHVIVSERKAWSRRLFRAGEQKTVIREIAQFLEELRSVEYDIVIDLQGLLKSGLLTALSRADKKIGTTGAREGSPLFLTERPLRVDYDQHAIDRYLKIADYLNCRRTSWKGEIPLKGSEKASVERLISQDGIGGKRLVAINPMARWKTKLWDTDKFAFLADRLAGELSCRIFFTGSRADRASIHAMMKRMKGRAMNLAGRTSLKELAYLYSVCHLIISTDTGPMHIGAAMGRPVAALFGPTAPWRTGPYGNGHRIIRVKTACSPCFSRRCNHMTCMKEIEVNGVFEAAKQLLVRGGDIHGD